MEQFFESAKKQYERRFPFVIYRKPNGDRLSGLFQNDAKLYIDSDFETPGFVMAPFDHGSRILIPESKSEFIVADWNNDLHTASKIEGDTDSGKEAFEQLVFKAIETMQAGDLKKVVLSRKESIELVYFDCIDAFKKMLNQYPSAFIYCFYHPTVGIWMGATPEQLLKVQHNKFETTALAGTQKFEGEINVDWGGKEHEEQQIVTDFILENLEQFTSDVAFSNPYTHQAGNLLHLKTDISGSMADGLKVRQLLEILHPTPAVCGLPKTVALDFIRQNEGYDRKYYSGYLGELNMGSEGEGTQTDLFVNLRCMEVNGNHVNLYAGCGITKFSDPEKEYLETVNKMMTVKQILK